MQADLPAASAQDSAHGAFASLFAEELGLVLEVQSSDAASIVEAYCRAGLTAYVIGKVRASFAPLLKSCIWCWRSVLRLSWMRIAT